MSIKSQVIQGFAVTILPLILGCYQNVMVNELSVAPQGRGLAVSSAEDQASQVAERIYQQGGNIVDAAVAASLALAVVRPQSTGLGGGGFLLYYSAKTKKTEAWDFRETAPAKAVKDLFMKDGKFDEELSMDGPISAAVPGLVAGLYDFHKRHGHLSWKKVVQPSRELASSGIKVSAHLAHSLKERKEVIEKDPDLRKLFLSKGRLLEEGETLVQEDLAETLRQIAVHGKSYFYRGNFATLLDAQMKKTGGILSADDLAHYRVKRTRPIEEVWKDFRVQTMPPPSAGVQILQILKIVDEIPPTFNSSFQEHLPTGKPVGSIVAEIEAMKRSFVDRTYFLGDPAFANVPLKKLLSPSYLETRAYEIEYDKIVPSADIQPLENKFQHEKQTTQLSLLDFQGNAISTTQSLTNLLGSGVAIRGTGVILNDAMGDFSPPPSVTSKPGEALSPGTANLIEAGKRPLSSMSPTLVLSSGSSKVRLALGAPGGAKIISSVYYVLSRILRDGISPATAISDCRFHHQWKPDTLYVEAPCLSSYRVLDKYYNLSKSPAFGEIQAVGTENDGKVYSITDPRGESRPAVEVH